MVGLLPSSYYSWLTSFQETIGPVSVIFIIIALSLIGGFGLSRFCKMAHIPYVTAYIILGILLGPSLFAFIPSYLIYGVTGGEGSTYFGAAGLSFLSDLTMGFIAFSCGKYFQWDHIKSGGIKNVLISIFVSLFVGAVSGVVSYLFYGVIFAKVEVSQGVTLASLGVAPALLIGCCAACISPTATASIIRQYHAKGHFTERIFQNIFVSNIVAILIFSFVLGLTTSGALGGLVSMVDVSAATSAYEAFKPLFANALWSAAGVLFAFILSKLNNYKRTNDSRIILTIAFVSILVALCSIPYRKLNPSVPLAKISPILPCMLFGITYLNFSKSEALFLQLDNFLPPILCLFFVVSGAKLNLRTFENWQFVIIAVVLVVARSGSQVTSTYTFGRFLGSSANTRKYLSWTMLTMTSVAVGLIDLASNSLASNEPMISSFVYPVILSACIILEMIGPLFAKQALIKTGSVDPAYFEMIKHQRETKSNITEEND